MNYQSGRVVSATANMTLPWEREGDERWHSRTTPVAFGLEGTQVALHTRDGRRLSREGEVELVLHRREEEAKQRQEGPGNGKR